MSRPSQQAVLSWSAQQAVVSLPRQAPISRPAQQAVVSLPRQAPISRPVRQAVASTVASQLSQQAAGGLPLLPLPPTDEEKTRYIDRNAALLTQASLFSFSALIVSQIRFVNTEEWLPFVFGPALIFTVLYYLISLCVNFSTRGFDLEAHRDLVKSWRPRRYPSLDIFLPIAGEHIDVLRNTWIHVRALVRAYPGAAIAHVLDDGASRDAQKLAAELGFQYIVRPNRGWFKKAGNLRHAFGRTAGDFILILDADFAPRYDLPAELLPYFDADPSLGIVQSPQYFRTHRHQSWTERGAAAVQELFYRLVQVSRDQHDGAICVGSCAIYRRDALAANGGGALIEHSEDVHTGFELRRAGWGLRYIPVPLATGLCPADPDSFLSQQYRWCAGSMSLLASRKFWAARLRLRTRMCYLSGFCYYVHTAIFTIVAPAIPLSLLIFMPERVRLINYVLIMPSLLYNMVVFPAWHRCGFGLSGFMAKAMYGWSHLFCLTDIVMGRRLGWQPTGATKRKAGTRRIWIAVMVWNVPTNAAWVGLSLVRMAQYGVENYALMLLSGVFAFSVTIMLLGARRNYVRAVVKEITGEA